MPAMDPSLNLREQVLAQLRSEIVSGRAAPGTVYTVPTLSTEMGVSTTPVREALLELSRNGLVSPMRNRGFRVEATSLTELENLFDLRVLLESSALVAVARRGLTDTAPLIALVDEVRDAVGRDDVRGYIDSDRRFHAALVARANNPLLTKLVLSLRDDMRLYGIDSVEGKKRQQASVGEHYQMIELAVAGESDAIAALITRHIQEWKPLFTAALQKMA